MALIECVPNFSEGRDEKKIAAIVAAVASVVGVSVLHVDSGYDANRTVVTFAGEPEPVAEAAFQAVLTASKIIDMSEQKGAHPRFGATDVCPFVPLSGSSFSDCVRISRVVGERVGNELDIPVYLYALSAIRPPCVDLAYVRKGEYEGLERRMEADGFLPDFGPPEINRKAGATAVGARDFLIAFNVNLSCGDAQVARRIASSVRKSVREEFGGKIPDSSNLPKNGSLLPLKALGWSMPTFGLAQISMNLLDFKKLGMFEAFELVKRCAQEEGIAATGSELVGLVPKAALLDAAIKSISKTDAQDGGAGAAKTDWRDLELDEKGSLAHALRYLGLEAREPFELENRVLEYRLEKLGLTLNF